MMDFSWEDRSIRSGKQANLLQVRLTVANPKTRVSVKVAHTWSTSTKKRPASGDPQWDAEAGPSNKLAKSSGSVKNMTDS
eukprot:4795966-Heterocapsa_arctica.AAC.1